MDSVKNTNRDNHYPRNDNMIIATQNISLFRKDKIYQAHVIMVQDELTEPSLHLDKLHPEEKKRYLKFEYKRRKKSYLLGRLASKYAIMSLTGISDPTTIWIDSGVFEFPVVRMKK